ncbi:MAG: type 1 periplasmic binding fold superfamily protein [Bacteroidota bacterium]
MKNYWKFLTLLGLVGVLFSACSKDDPEEENEEEVITTLIVTLDDGNGNTKTLSFADADADPNTPAVFVLDALDANTTYSFEVRVLNETETPAEEVTTEILEEDEDHQFFFIPAGTLNVTAAYTDMDADGNPIGQEGTMTTGDASAGNLTVILRHEPDKNATGVSDGDVANAGGETDIEVDFAVTIQ